MNGQPRKKDPTELAWSAIKRAITMRVNYEAQVWRERRLNDELDAAWGLFKDGLDNDLILGPGDEYLNLLGPGGEES